MTAIIPRFGLFEAEFTHMGHYVNPYVDIVADVVLLGPDGRERRVPLFWKGEDRWGLRFSPDLLGEWTWRVEARDRGLRGRQGGFVCTHSLLRGGIEVDPAHPHHFRYQDGTPFWWFGDTEWSLLGTSIRKRHNRRTVARYLDVRAAQGFNLVQTKVLHPQGWPNEGGQPFMDLHDETLNPLYWQEVDERLQLVFSHGMTALLYLAWWRTQELHNLTWVNFPSQQARLRFARYVVARYSAFNVAFCVSGEWSKHDGGDERAMCQLGAEVQRWDPHGRLITIHAPSSSDGGSVERFAGEPWMGFGDFQQTYYRMHGRMLRARARNRPAVNAEYAFYLRDMDGDSIVDKENSATLEDIRHASWDILMAGGYLCTGWGGTYFGGHRHPGPFALDDPRDDDWEAQVQHPRTLFTSLPWWTLAPYDQGIAGPKPVGADVRVRDPWKVRPPRVAYWALANHGTLYVAYMRGVTDPCTLAVDAGRYRVRRFDPRSGEFSPLLDHEGGEALALTPPDASDWVFVITRIA